MQYTYHIKVDGIEFEVVLTCKDGHLDDCDLNGVYLNRKLMDIENLYYKDRTGEFIDLETHLFEVACIRLMEEATQGEGGLARADDIHSDRGL